MTKDIFVGILQFNHVLKSCMSHMTPEFIFTIFVLFPKEKNA